MLFAGGFPFLGENTPGHSPLLGWYQVNGHWLGPPMIANFFQRPWCVGIPLWCAAVVLTLHCVRDEASTKGTPPDPWALALLGACVVALALSQMTLLATFLPAAGLALAVRFFIRRERSVLAAGCVLVLAGVAATGTHGFFAQRRRADAVRRRPRRRGGRLAREPALERGDVRPPAGARRGGAGPREAPAVLTLSAVVAAVVLNAVRYTVTWDVVKFAAVVSVVLSLGAAAALRGAWASGVAGRWFASAAGAVLLAPGVLYAAAHWAGRGNEWAPAIQPYFSADLPVDASDAAAVTWLRPRVAPPENLYRRPDVSYVYSLWGGLPTLWTDGYSRQHGMSDAAIAARETLRTLPPRARDVLWNAGVRWVVTDSLDARLHDEMENAVKAGTAQKPAQFGDVSIYRLTDRR